MMAGFLYAEALQQTGALFVIGAIGMEAATVIAGSIIAMQMAKSTVKMSMAAVNPSDENKGQISDSQKKHHQ